MPVAQGGHTSQMFRQPYRLRARQWSRMAWAMAFLFASMPAASKLFLGVWGFDGAAEIACLLLILGTYFHIVGRRRSRAMPDAASMLHQAIQLASSGEIEPAIALLTETIRLSPELWQPFQYRGELYLRQQCFDAALRDLDEAIRLAPEEPHLYILRGQAHSLLGQNQP
jgi:tetratricopeptide (TPR) repeat protein